MDGDKKKIKVLIGLAIAIVVAVFLVIYATPNHRPEPNPDYFGFNKNKPEEPPKVTTPQPTAKPQSEPSTTPAPTPEPSLTVEEFDKRLLNNLNVFASSAGIDPAESMGTPERSGNNIIYKISSTAHMEEILTGKNDLRGVNIIIHDLDKATIMSAFIFFFCAAEAFDPTVDINAVIDAISIDPNSSDSVKPKITTINGVTYEKKLVDNKSLILGIKR